MQSSTRLCNVVQLASIDGIALDEPQRVHRNTCAECRFLFDNSRSFSHVAGVARGSGLFGSRSTSHSITRRPAASRCSGAICNDTVTRGLPDSFVLFGTMRPDAVLTALPTVTGSGPQGGRRRKRGDELPKPEALARDAQVRWQTCEADLYGSLRKVRYKELCGQWYRACGVRLLRIVIVQVQTGTIGLRVFFSTDATLSVRAILEGYAGRWSIETCYRNLKQLLGFGDSAARTRAAVERMAPFVGLTYTFLVLWFLEHAYTHPIATPPLRPWYRHKQGFSFADVLRAAQRVLAHLDVLDPSRSPDNLHQLRASASSPSAQPAGRSAQWPP